MRHGEVDLAYDHRSQPRGQAKKDAPLIERRVFLGLPSTMRHERERAGSMGLSRAWRDQSSRRSMSARESVMRSVYSRSEPIGTPLAIRVSFTPAGFNSRVR